MTYYCGMCSSIILVAVLLSAATGQECPAPCDSDCGTEGLTRNGSNGLEVNIAYGKSANVSSEQTDGQFPGCQAVNGRTSPVARHLDWTNSNCVATATQDHDAWLQVDLGRNFVISNITIHREKRYLREMSGMIVMVENQTCYTFPNATADNWPVLDALPEQIDITCSSPLTGRTVRLQKHGDDRDDSTAYYQIAVCELQIWANTPRAPSITCSPNSQYVSEDTQLTCTCTGEEGYPSGQLVWVRRDVTDVDTTLKTGNEGDTSLQLTMAVNRSHDGVELRCDVDWERDVTGPSHTVNVARESSNMCPYTVVNDPISQKNYTVPETQMGKAYRSPDICFSSGGLDSRFKVLPVSDGEPLVTLHCGGDGLQGAAWDTFRPNQACNLTGSVTSSITGTLNNISQSVISEETATDVVNRTRDVLSEIDEPVGVDIVHAADIVQQIAGQDYISQETGRGILELVDTITQVNRTVLQESNFIGNATNRLIEAIEDIGDKIVFDNVTNVTLVSNKTAVEIWDLNEVTGDMVVGLELLQGGQSEPALTRDDLVSLSGDRSPTYDSTETALFLPARFIRDVVAGNSSKRARLTLIVFADSALFSLGRLEAPWSDSPNRHTVLNSKVISAKVTVDGVKVTDLRHDVVTTVFSPEVTAKSREAKTVCVFWNPAGSKGQGAWSREGCQHHATRHGREVCVCDHLTNFAVLLDFYGQDALPGAAHQTALSLITIIGLSLSIAGLSVTVLSFLLIKKQRQGRQGKQGHQQTLFQMALSMLGSWSVFLAGSTRVESHGGCVAVAALLHYFILASFMWMLAEGLLQYLLFVKVIGVSLRNYGVRAAVVAWGVPLIPVVTILAIDPNLYRGGDQYCWLSLTPFYFAFLAPVALILLINTVVYVLVIYNICHRRNSVNSGTNNRTVGIKASFACFVALGLSWTFAFFAISDARLVFQYLFTVTSTLQGFLVFLVFTARDPVVRAYWARLCCGCVQGKSDTTLTSRSKGSQEPALLGGGGRGGGGGGGGETQETMFGAGSKSDTFGDYK